MTRNAPRSPLRRPVALALRVVAATGTAALVAALVVARAAFAQQADRPAPADDEVVARIQNSAATSWRAPLSASDPVEIRLVGINDFHGNIAPGAKAESPTGARPMGGAAVLAAYIQHERLTRQKRTLTLVAGDSIGATPVASAFLHDEPTMEFLNLLADGDCKPLDRKDAVRMLRALSGKRHDVVTGVALQKGGRLVSGRELTSVDFAELSETDIGLYVATGECDDKAGAYALQGRGGLFVTGLEGSPSNVVGLPVRLVAMLARKLDVSL